MDTFIRVFLIIVQVVSGVLLVGIILIQKSKDEGMGIAFGASMGEALFGSRAGNVLTRTTIVLALIFLVNSLLLGMVASRSRAPSLLDRLPDGVPANAAQPMAAPQAKPAGPIESDQEDKSPASVPGIPGAGESVPAPSTPSLPVVPGGSGPASP